MISVVIPTYKRPELLRRLLVSIAKQTRLPEETIIVDDCSGMVQQYMKSLQEFEGRLPNLRFTSLEANRGAPAARNKGIELASGNWIALVDDDDEWLPEKLEKQWQIIRDTSDSRLGLVYTWGRAVGQGDLLSYESRQSVRGDGRTALLTTNFIISASVLVKREAILEAGKFDEEMPSCQDWDTWLNVCLAGYSIDVVEEVLTIYHRHGGESIGLSSKAKVGYRKFIEKHARAIVTRTSLLNIAKKTWLYLKVIWCR